MSEIGHTHVHGPVDAQFARRTPVLIRILVLVLVGVMAAAASWGMVKLWPRGAVPVTAPTDYTASGAELLHASVLWMTDPCPAVAPDQMSTTQGSPDCGKLTVRLNAGNIETVPITTDVSRSGLRAGDTVRMLKVPDAAIDQAGAEGAQLDSPYSYVGIDRPAPLILMVVVFVVVALVVARWRGLAALISLVLGGAVLVVFVAPALLRGENPVLVGLTASGVTMLVVLYLTHGVSLRTSTALVGTGVGLLLTAATGLLASDAARLTGAGDDNSSILQSLASAVRLHDLVACGVLIAAFGVLNDVTVTQTSAVWELRAASPTSSRPALFSSAMRIGRDHLASTVYTIVFAYAGAALPVLLLIALSGSFDTLFLSEDVTAEVVRMLASAIGLMLAIPATTALAVMVAPPPSVAGLDPVPSGRRGIFGRGRLAKV
jgi:uncharacterized membrane protein